LRKLKEVVVVQGNALFNLSDDFDSICDDEMDLDIIDLDFDETTDDLPENLDCSRKTELKLDFLKWDKFDMDVESEDVFVDDSFDAFNAPIPSNNNTFEFDRDKAVDNDEFGSE
jgi:hypothetical protein